MAKGGRYLKTGAAGGGKGKKGRKIVLAILLIFLLLLTAGVAGGVIYYNSMLNLITRPETVENSLSDEELEAILGFVPEKIETTEADAATDSAETTEPAETTAPVEDHIVNIMLIGQQFRKNEESKLSDTMILCSINKETKTITLTSFLRDLYVKLPDYNGHRCGKNRINVAYNLGWHWAGEKGGMEMLDQLLLETFGVEVDYNVEVGFEAFTQVIDVLGGVDVEMNADEARAVGVGYKAGTYHLDGEHALNYARTRSSNAGDNDFKRTNRQRTLITNLLNKCRRMSISDLNKMLKKVLPLVITDMTNEEITDCALELLPMLVDLKIVSNQCPTEDSYWFDMVDISGMESSVIKCDEEKNGELLRAITEVSGAKPKTAE